MRFKSIHIYYTLLTTLTVISILYILISHSSDRCEPARNIAYLKTHKTGSSAIQNLLFRRGIKYNLTFAVPKHSNYFGAEKPFTKDLLRTAVFSGEEINIFAIHTKWNQDEIESVMPNDTLYISSVRNPTDLFESIFTYSNLGKGKYSTIEEFVQMKDELSERSMGFLGYNQMSWDFGLARNQMTNSTAIDQNISKADKKFDLVLVQERMEESLILLRHLLCWGLEDIVVLNVNARMPQYKTHLSKDTVNKLRKRQRADEQLYAHFAKKFDNLVHNFGVGRMREEVSQLRKLKKEYIKNCNIFQDSSGILPKLNKPWSPMVSGYSGNTSNITCRNLLWTENYMLNYVRSRQRKSNFNRRPRGKDSFLQPLDAGLPSVPSLENE